MAWQSVDTVPLDFESGIAPERARAIASALRRHVLALLALRDGRAEPLASGALYWLGGRLLLLTCRHVFEGGAALGDLLLPLADSGRILPLARARPRLIEHPERDVAAIVIGDARARQVLLAHWSAVPLGPTDPPACRPHVYAVAGYPYAQMRRLDGRVVARPVVFFARAAAPGHAPWLAYGRIARRIDGEHVHAPPLDGVSGATLWAIGDAGAADRCLLQPAGVQSAFKHDSYARGEAFDAAWQLIERALAN
jgi:hypothetical protein